jgi:tetratricopeptide (TPR) repeat protein
MNISAIAVAPRTSAVIAALMTGILFAIAAFPYALDRATLVGPLDHVLTYLSTHGSDFQREMAWRVAVSVPGSNWALHREETSLAYRLRCQSRYLEAISHQLNALKISNKFFSSVPEVVLWDIEELAWLYHDYGQFPEAEAYYKTALKLSQERLEQRNFHTDRNFAALSYLCRRQGRFTEAEYYCKQRIKTADSIMIDFAWINLACIYMQQQKLDEAEKILKRPDLELPAHATLHPLVRLSQMRGLKEEAEATLMKAVGSSPVANIYLKQDLARLYIENGKLNEAEALLKKFDTELRALRQRSGYQMAGNRDLGELYKIQGRYSEAEVLLKAANKADLRRSDATPLDMAIGYNSLGSLYLRQKRFSNAEIQFRKALILRQHLLYPKHPGVGESLTLLAELCKLQGKRHESESCLNEASQCYKDIPEI